MSSTLLPPDDASNGFDNMAAGLSISPALIQGYTTAAMKLSRAAVGDMTATEATGVYQAPATLAQDQHLEGLPLGSRGGMRVVHNFPLDAEYHFSVRGGFSLDRNPNVRVDVAIDGVRVEPRNLRDFRLPVKAGPHVLTAALFDLRRPAGVNDIYSVYKVQGLVRRMEITGPFNATGPGDTESRRRIFSCRPAGRIRRLAPARRRSCSMWQAARFVPRSAPQDLAAIMPFFERGLAAGGFRARNRAGTVAHPGRSAVPVSHGRRGRRTWSWRRDCRSSSGAAFPTSELIDRAVAGSAAPARGAGRAGRRMLADERAAALVDNFAGQWLFLRQLATVTPEVEGFDENLREAFVAETRSLVEHVLRQDRPVTELLTADYSFLNERLARHYGIAGVRGSHLRKVCVATESPPPRTAGPRQHPHHHLDGQPHLAGDPRQLDSRKPAGFAAAGAAAGRGDQHRWRRHYRCSPRRCGSAWKCIAPILPAPRAMA